MVTAARLKAMATSMKDLVGDPLDDFAKKFTEEFIELGIRPGIFQSARSARACQGGVFLKVTGWYPGKAGYMLVGLEWKLRTLKMDELNGSQGYCHFRTQPCAAICSMYGISTKIYWNMATLLHTSIPCMDHMGQDSTVMWWYESWGTSLGNTEWGTSLLRKNAPNIGADHTPRMASEGHVQMYVLAVFKGFKGIPSGNLT